MQDCFLVGFSGVVVAVPPAAGAAAEEAQDIKAAQNLNPIIHTENRKASHSLTRTSPQEAPTTVFQSIDHLSLFLQLTNQAQNLTRTTQHQRANPHIQPLHQPQVTRSHLIRQPHPLNHHTHPAPTNLEQNPIPITRHQRRQKALIQLQQRLTKVHIQLQLQRTRAQQRPRLLNTTQRAPVTSLHQSHILTHTETIITTMAITILTTECITQQLNH